MSKAVTVRGRVADPTHIELDRAINGLTGLVEVVLRPLAEEEMVPRSVLGLGAHLGPAPTAEEIDEARREIWSNCPHDDIG